MSLTSYRAAPPRVNFCVLFWLVLRRVFQRTKGRAVLWRQRPFVVFCRERGFELYVLGRPGSDLLSQVLRHSTIGAKAFDGRVRDGIGSDHLAKATRPAKDIKFVSK
jgi:hypothetical protein